MVVLLLVLHCGSYVMVGHFFSLKGRYLHAIHSHKILLQSTAGGPE